ncbi:Fic family protein [Stomatohabitans albus]|uniref:Fic family protein n=1 Tax=Stomatohabitans albus TaxID=3110766 RepID=UPI00300D327F
MQREDFLPTAPGRIDETTFANGAHGITFIPFSLSRIHVDLSDETYRWIAEARSALSLLQGNIAQMSSLPIVRPALLRQEAQATSRIEGTRTLLHEVVGAQRKQKDNTELREVMNFVNVAETAYRYFEQVKDCPQIPINLLFQMQEELMNGMVNDSTQVGRTRTEQVFIGTKGHSIEQARFIPMPPGHDLEIALRDLIDYINKPQHSVDPIVAIAMAHYQFETLHPFIDGNGRLGRLLILLQLVILGQLSDPVLSISSWLEHNRNAYYGRLLRVSTHGSWNIWIRFMAKVIYHASAQTLDLIKEISSLNEHLHTQVRESNLKAETAHQVVDMAFEQLNFDSADIQEKCNVSNQRANQILKDLSQLGIIQVQDPSMRKNKRYTCPQITETLLRVSPSDYTIED